MLSISIYCNQLEPICLNQCNDVQRECEICIAGRRIWQMWDVWNALWVKCTDINQKCGKLTLTYCDQCCHLLFWGQCHNRLSLNQSHSVIHWNQYKTVMLMVSLKVPPLQCIDDIDCVNGVITLKYKKKFTSHFRTLSWVRVRDGHILTVDHETFISDPRFSSLPLQQNNIWTLQVGTVWTKIWNII